MVWTLQAMVGRFVEPRNIKLVMPHGKVLLLLLLVAQYTSSMLV